MLSTWFKNTKWYKVFDSEAEAQTHIAINKAVTVLIENKKICLARTPFGYHATDDLCPHNGAQLSKGQCNMLGEIVCPWHHFAFDLKLGHCSTDPAYRVNVYKTEMRHDGLYIGI